MAEDFLTTDQVAERYGVTRMTVTRWCQRGLIPGVFRLGEKESHARWVIPASGLAGFEPPKPGRPREK